MRHRPSSIPQTNVSQQRSQFPSPENGLVLGSAKTRFGATDPRGRARPLPKERSLVYACARSPRLIRSEHAHSVLVQHPKTIRKPSLSNRRTDRWHRQRGKPKPACDIGMRSVRGFGGRAYEFRDSQTSVTLKHTRNHFMASECQQQWSQKGSTLGVGLGSKLKQAAINEPLHNFTTTPNTQCPTAVSNTFPSTCLNNHFT
jgi:hypothetical protein